MLPLLALAAWSSSNASSRKAKRAPAPKSCGFRRLRDKARQSVGRIRYAVRSLDSVSVTLADGRRFRVLSVLDDFSRECLAAAVDTSLSGVRVVRELESVVNQRVNAELTCHLISDLQMSLV
jgi:putative transposase